MSEFAEHTKIFEQTEELLRAWARERAQLRRSMRRRMQFPGRSSITEMIDAQRVFETRKVARIGQSKKARKSRKVKGEEQQDLGPLRKCTRAECGHIHRGYYCPKCFDGKDAAIAMGYVKATPSAQGKGSRSSGPEPLTFTMTSRGALLNGIIESLPGWMRMVVDLAYADDQPDRVCARQMRLSREEFSRWRRATVSEVARLLAELPAAAVQR